MALIAALAITAILATVSSTAASVVMQEQAAKATQDAAKRQAEAQKRQAYSEDERLRRLRTIHMRRLREGLGASGIRSDVGTPLDVQLDTASELELDALNKRQTAIYNAEALRAEGLNRARGMELNAIATGLQGVATSSSIGITGAQALGFGGDG